MATPLISKSDPWQLCIVHSEP